MATAPPSRSPARRRLWLALGLVVLIAAGAGTWLARRASPPRPPELALDGIDPGVAEDLRQARARVVAHPESADAWGELGQRLFAADLRTEALTCFEQAERLDPGEGRWPYYQGLILLLGDPQAGIPALERAVMRSGSMIEPRLRLAEARLAEGELDEARRLFERVLAAAPLNARAHLGVGQLAMRQGRWKDSVAPLRQASASPFARKAASVALVAVYHRLGDTAAAGATQREADALPPDPPWPDPWLDEVDALRTGTQVRIDRAERLMSANRLPEAVQLLRLILQTAPDSDEARLKLAQAHAHGGEHQLAEQELRELLRRHPRLADGRFLLGAVLLQLERLPAAESELRQAIQLRPDFALAHFNLGQCLLRQGRKDDAAKSFRAALRFRPHLVAAHVALARLLLDQGDRAGAGRHLEDALKIEPNNAEARKLLGQGKKD